ncbi:MAG TPA: protein-glutamate O-methyltransferase CheR [Bacillales bacterium]|nr:protein-glutamate O-methyltransferase CheR [Bacillales bacterium]
MIEDYSWFVSRVHETYGVDLSDYKENQMKRRLTALRDQYGCEDFYSYFDKISAERSALGAFLERMTINVSSFYRNANRWEVLKNRILPRLIRNESKFKVWSAACSTGEEPYTLAMILSDLVPLSDVSILATDMDEQVLKRAKEGLYSENSLQEMHPSVKQKHFQKKDSLYWQIDESLKGPISFQKHNLLADAFPSRLDLIVCRNVLIYFTNEAKERLYRKFNEALIPGGILFVGSTEQIFYPERYGFSPEQTFFYRKVEG